MQNNFFSTIITLYFLFLYITHAIPIELTDTDTYLPSDDPNITNLIVFDYDCAKQHNLRQFNLLKVKQCTNAPSKIQHANVQPRVYANGKRVKAFKCDYYVKKEQKILFTALLVIDA